MYFVYTSILDPNQNKEDLDKNCQRGLTLVIRLFACDMISLLHYTLDLSERLSYEFM